MRYAIDWGRVALYRLSTVGACIAAFYICLFVFKSSSPTATTPAA
jgi:hypothetical protein